MRRVKEFAEDILSYPSLSLTLKKALEVISEPEKVYLYEMPMIDGIPITSLSDKDHYYLEESNTDFYIVFSGLLFYSQYLIEKPKAVTENGTIVGVWSIE
ncbi:hypothetical protein HDV06_006192 [Boothiomyces sp. JEL0866]|nr:hypothetical protein HDV06_006192 [Boothiomyces sp. JEL0866]